MSSFFVAGCFLGFVISVFAAVLVIIRNPRDILNRAFLITASASGAYCLFVGLYIFSSNQPRATFLHHASIPCWLIFLVAQLFFSMTIARVEDRVWPRLLLVLAALISLGMTIFDWSGATIYLVPIDSPFGYKTLPGPYYYYFTIFSILIACLQFFYFGVAWTKTKSARERRQVVTVMAGLAAGSFIGVLFDIIGPIFGFFTQSFAWLASTVYVGSFAYAMVRYGMLVVTPSAIANEIVDTMPDLLSVVGPDRKILLVNQRLTSRLGYPAEELIGKTMDWLIVVPDFEAFRAQLETTLAQNGMIKEQPAQLHSKQGALFPVRLAAVRARDQFGNELGDIMIFRDISEEQGLLEKQVAMIGELTATKERMLSILEDATAARDEASAKAIELAKAIEDLKVVDKMKTEFLSVVSHELRTPLTPIKGYVSLLGNETIGPLTVEQKRAVGVIGKEAEHLLELIDNVLDVSRMEGGRAIELDRVPVSLKVQVDKLVDVIGEQAKSEGKELVSELPADFPTIVADQKKIVRVLTNLIGNGLKFTPKGGKVRISGRQDGDKVRIEVNDNGLGLAKENLDKVFAKFFQVDTSYTRVAGGVGIGLSIAKEIVTAHSGQIWAESEGIGHGVTIVFTLPIS